MLVRAGFSLSRALFRKNVGGASPGAADPIFPGKKTGDFFSHQRLSVSCQFCTPIYFLLKKLATFFGHYCRFHSFTRVSPIVSGILLCCKQFRLLLWGLFCGASVRPNMLNMPKSAAGYVFKYKYV